MADANIIEIFCILDEFCKYFAPELKKTHFRLFFRHRLVAGFQAFQHPSHVDAEGAHRLQSFGILRGFARQTAMHAVPILGTNDGHVGYREM